MVLYPGVSFLNPPDICGGITVVLYLDNNGETDPPDPAGVKKDDAIGETFSLSFPLVAIIVWDLTYRIDVMYGTDGIFPTVK